MYRFKIILLSLGLMLALDSHSQQGSFSPTLGVDANVSTSGLGADIYYNFMPQITAKVGYSRLRFDFDINFRQEGLSLDTEIKYAVNSFMAGVDYQLVKFVYVSAGIGLLRFRPKANVFPVTNTEFGDIELSPEAVGRATVNIKNSSTISPYLGIGLGRLVPSEESRVSFAFEFGAYYMGPPQVSIDATGMLAPSSDPHHAKQLSRQISQYRFYPVVRLSMGVRLFK